MQDNRKNREQLLEELAGLRRELAALQASEEERGRAEKERERRVQQQTAELAFLNQRLQCEIDERRRAEQALAVFQKFADASGQGFGIADLEGHITYVNPKLCQMAECPPEAMVGQSFAPNYPDDFQATLYREVLPKVFQQGSWTGEAPLPTRSGMVRTVISNIFLLHDDGGQPAYIANVVTDISELKAAEEALRRERQILRNLLAAGDRDRQLISYEIHDGLTQQLTGAIMQMQGFESLQTEHPAEARQAYARGVDLLRASLAEARRLISGVRPPLLDDAGVVAAVENLVVETNQRGEMKIEFRSDLGTSRLQPVLENSIYRIIQESLTNACRHSRSDRVEIELLALDGTIEIQVRDWGVGFTAKGDGEGCFGLEGIQERARLLGGQAIIDSQLERGTQICVRLPLMLRELESEDNPR